jgi:hypothetical protein
MRVCLDLLLPFQQASSSSSTGTSSCSSSLLRDPAEGDANCQTRLANILYEWTDKTTDWSIFLSCDITSPTLGQDMYKCIILKYQLQGSCDIGVLIDRLCVPHKKDESLSAYWTSIRAARTYLAASGRPNPLTSLGDIIKLKTLPIHATWMKGISPSVTTEQEIEAMVYNFGIHLEFKSAKVDSSSSAAAGFAAVESQTEVIRLLTAQVASQVAQVAALTASASRNNPRGDERYRHRNDRGRGYRPSYRDRTSKNRDYNRDNRVCDGCGKTGHIIKSCPTFPDSPFVLDRAFPTAFPAALSTIGISHSLLWVTDSGASRHYSSILSDFNDFVHRDDLGTVSGINCRILGTGNISVSTFDHNGDPVYFTLLDIRMSRISQKTLMAVFFVFSASALLLTPASILLSQLPWTPLLTVLAST